MSNRRTIVVIGCLGSVCILVGCGGGAGVADAGSDGSFATAISDFGATRALAVKAGAVTMESASVGLPGDLLEDTPREAAITLSAADITVTLTGESSGRKNPAAKTTAHHASIWFHFGPRGNNVCDWEDEVGPFELTVEGGVVTLGQESLPLGAIVRSIVRGGEFEVCTETWADFDGSIHIDSVSFEFGRQPRNADRVVMCHISPGDPDNACTITVGAPAVDAHLAHGDYLGRCEERDAEADSHGDDAGVQDGDDSHHDAGGVNEDPADREEDDDSDSSSETDGRDADDDTTEADDPDDADEDDAKDDEDDGNDDDDDVTGGSGSGGRGGSAGNGGRGTPDVDDDDEGDRENVAICHIPPGNPDRRHTITVSEAAVEAHLAHGDLLGECDEDEDEPDVEDRDSDGDGVDDDDDVCPDTPAGLATDADGCSCSQRDADSDGVNDCDDQCSSTASGAEVDANGCSCAQLGNCDSGGECQTDADCYDDAACAQSACVWGRCVLQYADQVRYVDAGAAGANDGSSWDDAYLDLQDALAEANAFLNAGIAEIWVASAGGSPYTPAGPGGSRSVSFKFRNCLGIYGGFRGDEVFRGARDPKVNVTILSGDLNGDDDAGGGIDENSYHVVKANGPGVTAVLDGFTVTGGNANGGGYDDFGGGMYNLGGDPTVRNCVFVRNVAVYGGGMRNDSGGPTVSDCSFVENVAFYGGGVDNHMGPLKLVRCQFLGNSATAGGGGIATDGRGALTLTDSLLWGNSAETGGAIHILASAPILRNVTMVSNSASYRAGGLFNYQSLDGQYIPTISNCIFWKNGDRGGELESAQIYAQDANPLVSYTLIQGLDLYAAGTGNISRDPLFVSEKNLRLQEASPAIDAGDPGIVLDEGEMDLEKNTRVQDGRIDMGAYEFRGP